ncbi:MAG: Rieske 2Fe-2S domain-containing protein [Candidatus Glassbacteria bacterium]|nr:Rieske 2Fe-2S domain-containing protein [Candidatus Glassbacteria bacterium]
MAGGNDTGRRNFLNWLLGGGAVTFLVAVTYPVFKFLTPPPTQDISVEAVSAGTVDDFGNNSSKIIKFGSRPALVVRDQKGEFKAYIAICTHLDCTVQYLPDDSTIWCACHNGKYNLNGMNISGPPPSPLTALQVNVQDGEVFISEEA